jgi:Na+/proline symporter
MERAGLTPILWFLLLYVAAQLGLGAWLSRRVRSEADYLLAGRSLGGLLAAASIFATWFGAETCVGAAGEVYEHGLAAVSADPFGYGLALLAVGIWVAAPLRRRGYTTVADLFRERFSAAVERWVALLLVPGSLLWAAAQIRAFGHVVSSASALPLSLAILGAACIVVLYTTMGGLLADAYTDLIQGAVLVSGLLVLAWAILPRVELSALWAMPAPLASEGVAWAARIDAWVIPIVGSLFAQELAARVLAVRSPEVARRATLHAGAIYLCVGSIPVGLALAARPLLPGIESETVLPELARVTLGQAGFVIFAGALISAILSTVDSALLCSASLLSHNVLPRRLLRSERAQLRAARLCVVALGVTACGLAFVAQSVHALVQEASAFASAGIVVAGIIGLSSGFGSHKAALSAVASGAVGWILAAYLWQLDAPYLCSIGCALLGYLAGAWSERRAPLPA